jgi:ABC-2 type transport system permease protein
MIAIFKRELRNYFQSPTGYIFMGFFLLLAGLFFALTNLMGGSPQYIGVLSNLTFTFLIAVPVLTMRLISEERRHRTDILLITNPVSITGIVLGKYLAAITLFLITLAVTWLYPVIMAFFGDIAGWEIVGGYIGFLLLGCSFIAVGIFVSAMTENQVISAVVTFAALLLLWLIDWVVTALPKSATAGVIFSGIIAAGVLLLVYFSTRNWYVTAALAVIGGGLIALLAGLDFNRFDGFVVRFFEWLSLLKRFEEFTYGVMSLSSVVYFVSFASVFVFITIRVIDKKRWA